MKLKRLSLKNFQNIQDFTLVPKGEDLSVFGANKSGKTTLFNAFTYLFFGKDSLNAANFDIKRVDETGEAEHGLEHSVEGIIENGDGEIKLRRVYYEKYIKPKGKANRVFTGHTTDYFIDDVKVSMKEYNVHINSICDEDLFKLLSDPLFFNEKLERYEGKKLPAWQARRSFIIEICGDITDEIVISSNSELSDLPKILQGRKLEKHRKVIKTRQSKINEEVDKIPTRVSESKNGYNNDVRNIETVESDLKTAREEKKTAEEVLKEIKAGGESEVLTTKLREIENQTQGMNNKDAAASLKARTIRDNERRELWKSAEDIKYSIELIEKDQIERLSSADKIEEHIKLLERQTKQLRKDWHEEDVKTSEFKQSLTCPTCGQSFPKEKLEGIEKNALESFNNLKANKLISITNEGKSITEQVKPKKIELEDLNKKIAEFDKVRVSLYGKFGVVEKTLKNFYAQPETAPQDNPERTALLKEKEDLEKQIESQKGSVDPEAIAEGDSQINACDIRIESYEKELLRIEANKRIDVRIKELSGQERALAAEFEELERQLYLTEQFIRTKIKMLEEKINSKFKTTRFKMFDNLLNDGLSETCIATIDGVPYTSMSNSQRINCGLDIISTLSEYFDKSIPCFVDNAESVTDILPSKAQQVRLIVSKKDKKLRIEGGN